MFYVTSLWSYRRSSQFGAMFGLHNFYSFGTMRKETRVSHKMTSHRLISRAKSPIFYAITFLAVILIVYADSINSNTFLRSATLRSKEILEVQKIYRIEGQIPLQSKKEDIHEIGRENQVQLPLAPPVNVTEGQRLAWFQRKLPELKIFQSNNLTAQFHGRVLEFFNQKCEVHFFMTWISPARSFGRREFLTMESLFKVHPQGCLIILSTTMDSVQGYRILKPFLDCGFKVLAVMPDLPFLFKNTPAEAWFNEIKSGNKDPGEIPIAQNLSNLIRLSVLYKYGGVYLDTDFIVLKSFTSLRNSIGAQSVDSFSNWTRLNNAVLVFDMNHPLLFKFIEEFASTFDGSRWGHNGPYLVSRVAERLGRMPGYNVTVLPPMAFYPVDWTRIAGFFKKPESIDESKWVKAKLLQLSGETYGVHLWNKQSKRLIIEEGSILDRLISDNHVTCANISTSKR